jgi:PPOX class probable F420-dependent enzyme
VDPTSGQSDDHRAKAAHEGRKSQPPPGDKPKTQGDPMTNATAGFAALDGKKYLNLETYRKSGKGVRTPVWFATDPNDAPGMGTPKLYVYTTGDSGKAKRIQQTPAVKIAQCNVRGNVTGPWIDAHAEIVTGEEFTKGMRLLDRKYWPWKQLLNLFARLSPRHERIMLVIHPTVATTGGGQGPGISFA